MERHAHCLSCGTKLTGRQRKYCSRMCKCRILNLSHQNYIAQQSRGRARKLALVRLRGGMCQLCGYHNNYAALEFHHPDPNTKEFQLDLRSLSNRRWAVCLAEAEKCLLVCSNCHAELHNPNCLLDLETIAAPKAPLSNRTTSK